MEIYLSTPKTLHDAIRYNSLKFVQEKVRDGADLTEMSDEGVPPLWLAVRNSHPDIVRFLCQAGAPINYQDEQGATILMYAVLEKKNEQAQIFLSFGADMQLADTYGNTVAHAMAFGGNAEFFAMASNYLTHPARYFSAKNLDQKTPFLIAAEEGHAHFLNILSQQFFFEADKDCLQKSASAVAYNGRAEAFSVILEMGANPTSTDQSGKAPLHIACMAGHLRIISMILDAYPKSVNLSDQWGNTPLHYAVATANQELLTYLLQRKADDTIRNKEGQKPSDLQASELE